MTVSSFTCAGLFTFPNPTLGCSSYFHQASEDIFTSKSPPAPALLCPFAPKLWCWPSTQNSMSALRAILMQE